MFSSHEKFNPPDALPAPSQTLLLAQPLPLQQGHQGHQSQLEAAAAMLRGGVSAESQTLQGWFGVESIRTGPWCGVWESQWSHQSLSLSPCARKILGTSALWCHHPPQGRSSFG